MLVNGYGPGMKLPDALHVCLARHTSMRAHRLFWLVTGMLILAAAVCPVRAQNYPVKPVRIITPGPSAVSDVVMRLLATEMTADWGKQVIIENRAAAVAAETAARATPDGYTLSYFGASMWLAPFVRRSGQNNDPLREFMPISLVVSTPALLVVHPSLPVKSVAELIALTRSKPGELNYGSSSNGSTPHLGAELFKSLAHVSIVGIQYKGTGAAVNALLANEVQMMVVTPGSIAGHLKSGRMRAIAVTSTAPSALAPGLPTLASSVPGYELVSSWGVFAPAGTPAALISRINRGILNALSKQNVRERLVESGVEVVGSTPEQFREAVKVDMARWGKLIVDLGIRID